MKKALFPGTFDPFTIGHHDIVRRGLLLFDEIIIAIGINSSKTTMFDLELRLKWINDCYAQEPRVSVVTYSGLTINCCVKVNAAFILRGLRTNHDYEYEKQIAMVNADQNSDIETVFILSEHEYSSVSSTIIRDLIRHDGDYSRYLPDSVVID